MFLITFSIYNDLLQILIPLTNKPFAFVPSNNGTIASAFSTNINVTHRSLPAGGQRRTNATSTAGPRTDQDEPEDQRQHGHRARTVQTEVVSVLGHAARS